MCVAKSDVRFAPNSDRESGLPQPVMSALPPKADMCSAQAHVRFGPKADIPANPFTRLLRRLSRYFASLLMAFSDAFLLADQFSSRVAKVSVAGPVAFALARKAILSGVGQSTSNDERREDGEYECGLFHESITNFKPLDCRGARHVRFGSKAAWQLYPRKQTFAVQ